jgi:hypothetical protein
MAIKAYAVTALLVGHDQEKIRALRHESIL